MKNIWTSFLLILCGLFSACSDDSSVFVMSGDDIPVELTLSYKDISPTIVETRANSETIEDLHVFVFDKAGVLKGYTYVDKDDQSDDAENLNKPQLQDRKVTVKTRTGESFIHAIANANLSDIYKTNFTTVNGLFEVSNGNVTVDEKASANAQNKTISFTLDDFKNLTFSRDAGQIVISNGLHLMSGAVNGGESCMISIADGKGVITGIDDEHKKSIALRRIVSSVRFNISSDDNCTFQPTRYEIVNVPKNGGIVKGEKIDGVEYETIDNPTTIVQGENTYYMEVLLPENMQEYKTQLTTNEHHKREENSYDSTSGEKTISFTNAPEDGTYFVIYGKFNSETEEEKLEADVNYYIHLGNFSTDINNYDNERNYKYTYNIKVVGVDKIIAEAEKKGNEQPGSEGFVINYTPGKSFDFDAHYEMCVMRFYRSEILNMKAEEKGYIFRVKTHQGETESIMVTDNDINLDNGKLNGVNIDWIQFHKGGTYDEKDNYRGGTPLPFVAAYKEGTWYNIPELLKYLYDNADTQQSDVWQGEGDNQYLDFTCYLNENYYENESWDKYVNVDPRVCYIANNIQISDDEESIYATVQYGISQRSIKTFYDRSQAGSIIAYGCESINDEELPYDGGTRGDYMKVIYNIEEVEVDGVARDDKNEWDGKKTTKKDIKWNKDKSWESFVTLSGNNQWDTVEPLKNLHEACMSRNRDLNGTGVIEEEEIRWYTPSLKQYMGLWIGEESLGGTKLYDKSLNEVYLDSLVTTKTTTDNNVTYYKITNAKTYGGMYYLTSTAPNRRFWAEEGMAFGKVLHNNDIQRKVKYVRCVRNLESGTPESPGLGVDVTPRQFYSYEDNTFNLEYVDKTSLRTSIISASELNPHHERDASGLNKPRSVFKVAETYIKGEDEATKTKDDSEYDQNYANSFTSKAYTLKEIQESNGSDIKHPCADEYKTEKGEAGWRIPNQRELALMILEHKSEKLDMVRYTAARTSYSGKHRFGYWHTSELNMIEPWSYAVYKVKNENATNKEIKETNATTGEVTAVKYIWQGLINNLEMVANSYITNNRMFVRCVKDVDK